MLFNIHIGVVFPRVRKSRVPDSVFLTIGFVVPTQKQARAR